MILGITFVSVIYYNIKCKHKFNKDVTSTNIISIMGGTMMPGLDKLAGKISP